MFNINEVIIEDMKADKFAEVAELELLLEKDHGDTIIEEELHEMFDSESLYAHYHGRVAVLDGEVIGYSIRIEAKVGSVGVQSLYRLAVREDYRREGIGSKLMDAIDTSEHPVLAEVPETQYEKMAFLKTNGFVVTRLEEALYEDDDDEVPVVPAYFVMRKERKPELTLENRLKWRAP